MGASSTNEAHAALWNTVLRISRHLSKRIPLPIERHPFLVELRKGAAGSPVVYFIGIGFAELHLTQLIDANNSIFAIEVPWPSAWHVAARKNKTSILPTMEQLVAPYVSALSVHAGLSRCVLAGHSFSGLMAFEVAHQFNRSGGQVELVILLDSKAKYPPPHVVAWQKLKRDWTPSPDLRAPTPEISFSSVVGFLSVFQWMLVRELKLLWHSFRQTALGDLGPLTAKYDDLGTPLHWAVVERVYFHAVKNYRLQRLDCRGVLFLAEPIEEKPARDLDGSMGWGNLFGRGLETLQMTGDHLTMMQRPHSLALAREISTALSGSIWRETSS